MNRLVLLLFAAALIGCNGGSESSSESKITNPSNPVESPFDPDKDYLEVYGSWIDLIPGEVRVMYDSYIDRLYVCNDLSFCDGQPSKSPKLNPGECMTIAAYTYGAYRVCHTTIEDELTIMDSIWLSMEEL